MIARDTPPSGAPAVIRESLQGQYAGFASRFAAFAADVTVSARVFMLTRAAISFAARVLTGKDIHLEQGRHLGGHRVCSLGFVHFAYCWAANGRTAGVALFDVRVVTDDSTDASGRRTVVCTLALPLSFLSWD